MSEVTSHSHTLHRHLLHHYPFFPLDSSSASPPPSLPPQSQQPNYPFSTSSSNPFFPSNPPPPPPSSIASFPANISSLILPTSYPSSSHHHKFKLIAISISLSALLLVFLLLGVLIVNRRRRRNAVVSHKPLRSGNSEHSQSPTVATTSSDGTVKLIPPTLRGGRGIIGTSTEFLYLGTVAPNSPELRPLPPLPKFNHFTSGEQITPTKRIDEEDEEFFSPRGSSSGSRRVPTFVDDRSRDFNSKTASFSVSNSTSSTLSGSDRNAPFVLCSLSLSSSPEIELRQSHSKFPLEDSRMNVLEKSQQNPKLKLKPMHWNNLRSKSEKAMAWDDIKSSSIKLNEEMKSLFMVKSTRLVSNDTDNILRDSSKSHNIAILLRAMNITADEVREALLEGNTDALGSELLESLLNMAPCKKEEQCLKEFEDESPLKLDPADNFLKTLLETPYAFERMDAMLYMTKFDSEVEYLSHSFQTLQAACDELKRSKMFLKLLQAVFKTGNQINNGTNRGDALSFRLDTLLKLVDVKGADGKTTLLHFVVQKIVKDEDPTLNQVSQLRYQDEVESKKRSLQIVTNVIGELSNVKKAAEIDFSILGCEVIKLASQISKVRHALRLAKQKPAGENIHNFTESVTVFLNNAEAEIARIQLQQTAAFTQVKEVTEYFHRCCSKVDINPFRIFLIVRDFLSVLDRVCKDIEKEHMRTIISSGNGHSSFHPDQNLWHAFPQFNLMQQSFGSVDQDSSSLNFGLAHSSSI